MVFYGALSDQNVKIPPQRVESAPGVIELIG